MTLQYASSNSAIQGKITAYYDAVDKLDIKLVKLGAQTWTEPVETVVTSWKQAKSAAERKQILINIFWTDLQTTRRNSKWWYLAYLDFHDCWYALEHEQPMVVDCCLADLAAAPEQGQPHISALLSHLEQQQRFVDTLRFAPLSPYSIGQQEGPFWLRTPRMLQELERAGPLTVVANPYTGPSVGSSVPPCTTHGTDCPERRAAPNTQALYVYPCKSLPPDLVDPDVIQRKPHGSCVTINKSNILSVSEYKEKAGQASAQEQKQQQQNSRSAAAAAQEDERSVQQRPMYEHPDGTIHHVPYGTDANDMSSRRPYASIEWQDLSFVPDGWPLTGRQHTFLFLLIKLAMSGGFPDLNLSVRNGHAGDAPSSMNRFDRINIMCIPFGDEPSLLITLPKQKLRAPLSEVHTLIGQLGQYFIQEGITAITFELQHHGYHLFPGGQWKPMFYNYPYAQVDPKEAASTAFACTRDDPPLWLEWRSIPIEECLSFHGSLTLAKRFNTYTGKMWPAGRLWTGDVCLRDQLADVLADWPRSIVDIVWIYARVV